VRLTHAAAFGARRAGAAGAVPAALRAALSMRGIVVPPFHFLRPLISLNHISGQGIPHRVFPGTRRRYLVLFAAMNALSLQILLS